MKIKKLTESKKLIEEADGQVNPIKDSKADIVDEIESHVEETTDGEKGIEGADAEAIAQQTKKVGDEVNAGFVAFNLTDDDWSDVTITNDVYEILDMAYQNALINMDAGVKAGSNVLVNGLPGSGKTAIVEAWAKAKGLELVAMNATDSKSDAAINGMPVRDAEKPDELIYLFNNKKLAKLMDPKYEKKCVIFVDELNRQKTAQLRRPLMSLFNEKRNADGSKDFSKNLLFSIVCINPADGSGGQFHDDGLVDIFGAEDDRFVFQIEAFDSTIKDAISYYTWYRQTKLLQKGVLRPGSAASINHGGWVGPTKELSEKDINEIKRMLKVCELALYILNNVTKSNQTEIFSQRKDIDSEYRAGKKRAVSARGLFDAVTLAVNITPIDKSPVPAFLNYVDKISKWSPTKQTMFHDILDDYIMDVKGLFAAYNLDKKPQDIQAELNNPGSGAAAGADTDTNSPAADDIEDDDEMFGDDDIGSVSKANSSDLDTDEVDQIMAAWEQD